MLPKKKGKIENPKQNDVRALCSLELSENNAFFFTCSYLDKGTPLLFSCTALHSVQSTLPRGL